MSEKRLKAIEENLAWILKELQDLKEIRTVEVHTHYTNILKNIELEEDFEEPLY